MDLLGRIDNNVSAFTPYFYGLFTAAFRAVTYFAASFLLRLYMSAVDLNRTVVGVQIVRIIVK